MKKSMPPETRKILVVLGPTASGKSALAVKIATWLKRRGEQAAVVSADSRQVYRRLNIGTCKIPGKWRSVRRKARSEKLFTYKNIPHYMIDFASPRRQYSVAEYAAAGQRVLAELLALGSVPIVCGGSGQYIDALLGEHFIPDIPPNPKLRARLGKRSTAQLYAKLRKLDPRRAKTIDRHNPRRLIRALEIVLTTGKPVPTGLPVKSHALRADVLKIGLAPSPDELRRRIEARLEKDVRGGLIAETKKLHAQGLSWKRLDELGLEYRLVARYVRHGLRVKRYGDEETKRERLLTRDTLLLALERELWRYAKRQLRWFRRDKTIRWFANENDALRAAAKLIV